MVLGKAELLELISGKNRGLLASENDKQAILAAIARLVTSAAPDNPR